MRLAQVAVPLASLVLLSGCGAPSFDAPTLGDRVGATFANLYVRAQLEKGRRDLQPAALQVTASCQRGGGDTPDEGPGDDWRCLLRAEHPLLGAVQVLYEVNLKPEGCFSAEGPPAVVGDVRVQGPDGTSRLNPIYAFDGCL